MSVLTFKRLRGVGYTCFRVSAGARDLGTITDYGTDYGLCTKGGNWRGTAPDGTRFAAASKPAIAELLRAHARQERRA